MRRVAALLAAVLLGAALAACGGGGAEPGAPKGATLVLDFQPNAVHTGLYAAQAEGYFEDAGIELTIREPSSTADSAKLLETGRADFAIMDINDFGLARERGLDLVAIAAIVQRPLASVIAGDRDEIRTPADLAGETVGVTGVPSDEAVLDTILRSGGVDSSNVDRVNIGFNAVAALAGGKVDAATAFWNAEGVQLGRLGLQIGEFMVDQLGAPRYPELLVVTLPDHAAGPATRGLIRGLERGYRILASSPDRALSDLLDQVQGLDADLQRTELDALTRARAFSRGDDRATPALDPRSIRKWRTWASDAGLLDQP